MKLDSLLRIWKVILLEGIKLVSCPMNSVFMKRNARQN